MITRARFIRVFVVSLLPLSSTGCIVINGHGWWGSTVWTESTTERLPIDTANLKGLEVRTHNGSISFEGRPTGTPEAYVIATKKAGAHTHAGAEEALQALEVYVEPGGDDTQRVGWRWRGLKRPTWAARVSFDIRAPGNLRFDGQTHNGPIKAKGITGDVRVVTHNGPVNVTSIGGQLYARTHNGPVETRGVTGDLRVLTHNGPVSVESTDGKLYAETHNGTIVATYTGDDVTVKTHNGSVSADLQRCAALTGSIRTHNGGVEVVLGEEASTRLKCRTHNGAIKCNVPLTDGEHSRRRLTGTIGAGEGSLNVTTHNGSVRIDKASG